MLEKTFIEHYRWCLTENYHSKSFKPTRGLNHFFAIIERSHEKFSVPAAECRLQCCSGGSPDWICDTDIYDCLTFATFCMQYFFILVNVSWAIYIN